MDRIQPEDFWQWAFSDFLSNSLRGILAEYIVGKALNATGTPRTEWDAYDLITPDGLRIEVKSSGYLQTWSQTKPSIIQFDIAKKRAWYAETNTMSGTSQRTADIYVFCVFAETRKELADPLDLNQWFFLVASAEFLEQVFKIQKTVSLSTLERKGLERLSFSDLQSYPLFNRNSGV
jgi:hypothetical protein